MYPAFSGVARGPAFPTSHSPSLLGGGASPAHGLHGTGGGGGVVHDSRPTVNGDGASTISLRQCKALSMSPEGDAVVVGGDRCAFHVCVFFVVAHCKRVVARM